MISILIPTYNDDCTALVDELRRQMQAVEMECEVIVADDCSPDAGIRAANRAACSAPGCRYVQSDVNLGPARLRNRLAQEAGGDYLLFLDSDAIPCGASFLAGYAAKLLPGGVVCGGFAYKPLDEFEVCPIRYKYGIRVESEPLERRARQPYASFKGVNFCAHRSVFDKVRFDETIHFGYEDAYFGLMLKEAAIPVRHIDNPVWHLSRDGSEAYLDKVRRAVCAVSQHIGLMRSQVRLLRYYTAIRRLHLDGLAARLFAMSRRRVEANLTGDDPSLRLFAFYKLGYLCSIMRGRGQGGAR